MKIVIPDDYYELYFGTAFDHLLAFFAGKPTSIINPEVLKS